MGKVSFTTKDGKKVSFTAKGGKKAKNKSNPSPKGSVAKGKTSKKRKAANVGTRIYNRMEKAIGAARIAERVMNLVGMPPEPWRSLISTGVGFARGGVEGGLGAAVVSSNLLEMGIGAFQGGAEGFTQGFQGNGGDVVTQGL